MLELAGDAGSAASLLAINVLGSGLLGVLVGAIPDRRAWLRPFAGTGVLGGFTTFSAAIATTVGLADDGALLAPVGYLTVSLLASVLAAGVGLALGETVRRRRRGTPPERSSPPAGVGP